jgi:hypothetical protein
MAERLKITDWNYDPTTGNIIDVKLIDLPPKIAKKVKQIKIQLNSTIALNQSMFSDEGFWKAWFEKDSLEITYNMHHTDTNGEQSKSHILGRILFHEINPISIKVSKNSDAPTASLDAYDLLLISRMK